MEKKEIKRILENYVSRGRGNKSNGCDSMRYVFSCDVISSTYILNHKNQNKLKVLSRYIECGNELYFGFQNQMKIVCLLHGTESS